MDSSTQICSDSMSILAQCSLNLLTNPSTSIHLYFSDDMPIGHTGGYFDQRKQLQMSSKRILDMPNLPKHVGVSYFVAGVVDQRIALEVSSYFVINTINPRNLIISTFVVCRFWLCSSCWLVHCTIITNWFGRNIIKKTSSLDIFLSMLHPSWSTSPIRVLSPHSHMGYQIKMPHCPRTN